jgi:hypothetical protein
VKRHFAVIVAGSATVLAIFGVLLIFDQLTRVTIELQKALDGTGLDWIVNLG